MREYGYLHRVDREDERQSEAYGVRPPTSDEIQTPSTLPPYGLWEEASPGVALPLI